jgi:hypothetical protein
MCTEVICDRIHEYAFLYSITYNELICKENCDKIYINKVTMHGWQWRTNGCVMLACKHTLVLCCQTVHSNAPAFLCSKKIKKIKKVLVNINLI